MQGMDGIAATKAIRQYHPEARHHHWSRCNTTLDSALPHAEAGATWLRVKRKDLTELPAMLLQK